MRGSDLVPAEVRPHLGAALAAGGAHEARLEIGNPGIIWPGTSAGRNRVAAVVIGAIEQELAHTGRAHVGKGDLLLSL